MISFPSFVGVKGERGVPGIRGFPGINGTAGRIGDGGLPGDKGTQVNLIIWKPAFYCKSVSVPFQRNFRS